MLSFKFLKGLSDEEAAAFLHEVLVLLGDAYDTGDVGPLIAAAYKAQIIGYSPRSDRPSPWTYDDRPFTPLPGPLSGATVGLLTSSGHFAADDDPKPFGVEDMTQQEAEDRISEFLRDRPVLSEIAYDTPDADLAVRHGGFDIRSASRDANVVFPRDRMTDAASVGRIGRLTPTLYSFCGATAQRRLQHEIPDWVERIKGQGTDVLLLVPV